MPAGIMYYVDPYFHYHAPYTDRFYYLLYDERTQNDGITRYFDYNALITGTSMQENSSVEEVDRLFGTKGIKVCFSGGSYKEVNDCVIRALRRNRHVLYVFRCLDPVYMADDAGMMRTDLGKYPTYLYDDNPLNDFPYLFNKDLLFSRCIPMIRDYFNGKKGGITSFDQYSSWAGNPKAADWSKPGNTGIQDTEWIMKNEHPGEMTADEKEKMKIKFQTEVTDVADKYPETTFYYYIPPYSIQYWHVLAENNCISHEIEQEKYAVGLLLQHKNIRVFSFISCHDIITNPEYYQDVLHYYPEINEILFQKMEQKECCLQSDNYENFFDLQQEFFEKYDYSRLADVSGQK